MLCDANEGFIKGFQVESPIQGYLKTFVPITLFNIDYIPMFSLIYWSGLNGRSILDPFLRENMGRQ